MKSKDELLKDLSSIIIGYLNKNVKWSHFSDTNGTTRAAIAHLFINSNGNINSEEIRERVMNDIDRDLTESEEKKFCEIQESWGEWQYIKPFIQRSIT
ncbi:MAG: hypothetical protein K2X50_02865 [Gammaproteobacteria bacterium]|nr:hypothetical protein [Gammaproteobacteria bacterium]